MRHEDVKVGMQVVLIGDPNKIVKEITRQFHDSTWIVEDPQTLCEEICYASDFEPYIEPKEEKTMSKLKMKVAVFEKAIAVQILEMDERFRNPFTGRYNKYHSVISEMGPSLSETVVCLRGANLAEDFRLALRHFESNRERDDYLVFMKQALTDWAENWEGWKEKKEESETKDSDIWEF